MKNSKLKQAFVSTIPVMTGYLVLGFGFGVLLHNAGYGPVWALFMSITMYAGTMQYVAVSLLSGGAALVTTALTTLMVNARHLFYGISLMDQYKDLGRCRPYLMFALTDETYSLLCTPPSSVQDNLKSYYFWVSLLNHIYWITGCVLGAVAGMVLPFNSEGIEFVLTARFISIATEQWLTAKTHVPVLIGIGATALSLVLFGRTHLLMPAMAMIAGGLLLWRKRGEEAAQ